jgi:hypothetical protein
MFKIAPVQGLLSLDCSCRCEELAAKPSAAFREHSRIAGVKQISETKDLANLFQLRAPSQQGRQPPKYLPTPPWSSPTPLKQLLFLQQHHCYHLNTSRSGK